MDPALLKIAIGGVVLLGCIGLFFGIGLAIAAHKFAVETNPLIEEVLERADDPVIDGAAERAVTDESLCGLALVVLFPDTLLHQVQVDAG